MPVNSSRIQPIIDTNRAKRFHRDEKTKKLIKRYEQHGKNNITYDGKTFSEILDEKMAKTKY